MAQFRASGGIRRPLEFVKTFSGKEELGGCGEEGTWCPDPPVGALGNAWGWKAGLAQLQAAGHIFPWVCWTLSV